MIINATNIGYNLSGIVGYFLYISEIKFKIWIGILDGKFEVVVVAGLLSRRR